MSTYPTMVRTEPGHWESEEQRDGVPDFTIDRVSPGKGGVRMKMRTAQKGYRFDTIIDARDYVASIGNERIRV